MNFPLRKEHYVQWFKYLVYGLLVVNTLMFFHDEWLASEYTFSGPIPLMDLISAFSATIDTASWVLLLLLFELETYQIPPEKWTPPLSISVHLLRVLCSVFIIYAFYGYLTGGLEMHHYAPAGITDPCLLTHEGYSMLVAVDEYITLGADNCALYGGTELFRLDGTHILASPEKLSDVRWLSWLDVINAFTWIMVVLVLEVDVRLQEKNLLRGGIQAASVSIKTVLYVTLLIAAVYWGFEGDFLDFWDAFLWLVAFIFIEMNVIQWNEEMSEND